LLVGASVFVMRWLRGQRVMDLIAGCACLVLASTVRYEAWFFSGTFLIYLAGRDLLRRDIYFGRLTAVSAILMGFPVFWIAHSYWWYGSLDNLSITSWQFIETHGRDYYRAFGHSPLGAFAKNLLWSPLLLLGIVALCWLAFKDRLVRAWAAIFFVPFPLITAVMIASMSIPDAAPWRTSGAWIFLLLPFTALAMVRASESLRGGRAKGWLLSGLLLIALVPSAMRTAQMILDGMLDEVTHDW